MGRAMGQVCRVRVTVCWGRQAVLRIVWVMVRLGGGCSDDGSPWEKDCCVWLRGTQQQCTTTAFGKSCHRFDYYSMALRRHIQMLRAAVFVCWPGTQVVNAVRLLDVILSSSWTDSHNWWPALSASLWLSSSPTDGKHKYSYSYSKGSS